MSQNAYFVEHQHKPLITIRVIRYRGMNPRGEASAPHEHQASNESSEFGMLEFPQKHADGA